MCLIIFLGVLPISIIRSRTGGVRTKRPLVFLTSAELLFLLPVPWVSSGPKKILPASRVVVSVKAKESFGIWDGSSSMAKTRHIDTERLIFVRLKEKKENCVYLTELKRRPLI